MDPQLAFTLLTMVHEPRAMYLAQCVEPEICAEAMQAFDAITLTSFRSVFGQDISPYWMEHPAGAGLYSMHRLRKTIHERVTTPGWRTSPGADSLTHVVLSELGPPKGQNELAHVHSATGHKSREWLYYRPGNHMQPHKFLDALRIRCRATHVPDMVCTCGIKIDAFPNHLLSCRDNRDYTWTHRHNEVLYEIARVSRMYGLTVVVEPRCYSSAEDKRRPDLTFCLGLRSVAADLTIVDATCPSHTAAGASEQGKVASDAAYEKIDKHTEAVTAFGHTFFPLAMETLGLVDHRATEMFRRIALELPAGHLRKHFLREVSYAMTTTAQAGNAAILDTARRRLRGRAALVH